MHKSPDLIRNLAFMTFLIFSTVVSLFQKFNGSKCRWRGECSSLFRIGINLFLDNFFFNQYLRLIIFTCCSNSVHYLILSHSAKCIFIWLRHECQAHCTQRLHTLVAWKLSQEAFEINSIFKKWNTDSNYLYSEKNCSMTQSEKKGFSRNECLILIALLDQYLNYLLKSSTGR